MKHYILIIIFFIFSTVVAYAEPQNTTEASQPETGGTITGQVLIRDKTPMKNGIVLLYSDLSGPPPSFDKYWRVPDIMTETDSTGHFSISLNSGTYYLQVAQKNPNGEIGPVNEDEYLYFHGDNKHRPLPLVVTSGTINLGKLIAQKFPLSRENFGKNVTSIEGKISDSHGNPVEQMVVFAHLSEELRGRPVFVSSRTDKKGTFILRVHEGTYFLKARNKIGGGPPRSGEFQNVTDNGEPVKLTVNKGQKLKGIILTVNGFSGKGATELSNTPETKKVWKNLKNIQGK